MLIPVNKIKVNPGRREADLDDVQKLADSIESIGLLNAITVDQEYTLIAGLHRLNAAKLLGWVEIECTVSSLDGLQAELAEIDENIVRKGIFGMEYNDLLLRRKEIYEAIHPETKRGGDRKSEKIKTKNFRFDSAKPFSQDTAEKLGVTQRTVELQIQAAKNMTPEAKSILRNSDAKITKQSALKLSRLPPDEQREAATQLATHEIKSMNQYKPAPSKPEISDGPSNSSVPDIPDKNSGVEELEVHATATVPYSFPGKQFSSFKESVADLKNPDKDCTYTPDVLLAELDAFIDKFHTEFAWYSDPLCAVAFPAISQVQFDYVQKRLDTISEDIQQLLQQMKRSMKP